MNSRTEMYGDKMSKKKEDDKIEEQSASVDYSSKSVRQAAFLKSCKEQGLTPKEIVEKAKLFQGIDVSRFKLVRMPPP